MQRGIEYALTTLLVANIFMTPPGFIELMKNDVGGLFQFTRSSFNVWPNIFALLGETRPGTIPKIIFLTGNPLNFAVVILGVFSLITRMRTENQKRTLFIRYVPIVIFIVTALSLSLGAERFALFLITPFAIFAALGIEILLSFLIKLFSEIKIGVNRWVKPILCGVVAIVFCGSSFVYAYASTLNLKPIMNRTWYNVLKEISERTPENAIVNSWWDPGYFIVSIAERRATSDGGTPHYHQNYWMARALTTDDETKAAGILRMLNTSANLATDLAETKLDSEESVQLISNIIPLERGEAKKILRRHFNQDESEQILELIHGSHAPPPSYLFLYNQIIEMNAALTIVANWDFGRAKAMRRLGKSQELGDYFHKIMAISGDVWRYNPEAFFLKKEGDKVFFTNGVSIDMTTLDTMIDLPKEKVHEHPRSLFYVENGKFLEKKFEDSTLDVACLLIRTSDKVSTVLANPNLIKSMLFRLYYLNGEGLKIFQPFTDRSDADTQTTLRVFKIDWDKLKEHDV